MFKCVVVVSLSDADQICATISTKVNIPLALAYTSRLEKMQAENHQLSPALEMRAHRGGATVRLELSSLNPRLIDEAIKLVVLFYEVASRD